MIAGLVTKDNNIIKEKHLDTEAIEINLTMENLCVSSEPAGCMLLERLIRKFSKILSRKDSCKVQSFPDSSKVLHAYYVWEKEEKEKDGYFTTNYLGSHYVK
jgi:hypothetical protein